MTDQASTPPGCLQTDTVLALVQGQLTPAEVAAVDDHVAGCERCRQLLALVARLEQEEHEQEGEQYDEGLEPTEPEAERGEPSPSRPSARELGLLPAGTMVGQFRVMRLVGAGGMSEVYLARDTQLGRKVALKLVRTPTVDTKGAVDYFLIEARATARCNHPNIVTIHAVGDHEGRPYLALEYVEGETLRERLDRQRLGVRESVRIGLAIIEAVREAHGHQILHRDLKPGNIILARDGRPRVLDFGLAKVMQSGIPDFAAPAAPPMATPQRTLNPFLTDGNCIVGSPAYMAPEQWLRRPATPATDVWAIGLILYEMLAGGRPYRCGGTDDLRDKVVGHASVPSDGLTGQTPPPLVRLVMQCLDKDPSRRPSVDRIIEALLDVLSQGTLAGSETGSPFRGLLPFQEQHANIFFGRDQEVGAIVERLQGQTILPVVGASGAGKSSLVQAGVIPRLREQRPWLVLAMRPGRRPFVALITQLLRSLRQADTDSAQETRDLRPPRQKSLPGWSGGLDLEQLEQELLATPSRLSLWLQRAAHHTGRWVLLFVDQLEELFTLVEDAEVAQRFMQALSEAADDPQDPVRVVFTLREEFLSRAAEGRLAREALSRLTVVRSPGPSALQEILVRPLQRVSYHYDDPDLVPQMVREVQGEPACLPLLQFATHMLWEHRDRSQRLLLRSVYEEIGGIAGALARHADGLLESLPQPQVELARRLMLRLVNADGTRRVVAHDQLLEGLAPEAADVLDQLTGARLVSTRRSGAAHSWPGADAEQADLELVHESLVQAWHTLARWIEESREDLVFFGEVGQMAALWEKRGRRQEELWEGEALVDALRTLQRCSTPPPEPVRRFLEAARTKGQRAQRRRRRRTATAVALLALIAVAALAATGVMVRQKNVAERQRRVVVARQAETQLEGARAALLRDDLLEARARLRASLEGKDSMMARVLWWRLERDSLVWTRPMGSDVYAVQISPDRSTIAAACGDQVIYLLDPRTRGLRRALRGHRDQVYAVAYSPDGRYLASGSWDGEVRVWEASSGRTLRVLAGHRGGVRGLSFSRDGKLLASGGFDRTVRTWRLPGGEPRHVLTGHTKMVRSVSFSPDGRWLLSGAHDNTVRVWDMAGGKQLLALTGHTGPVRSVAWSPDGKLVASGSADESVRLWDPVSGGQQRKMIGHRSGVRSVSFDPAGGLLASAGGDGSIRLWEVATGRARAVLLGHREGVHSVSFGPRGELLASSSHDQSIALWRPRLGTRRQEAAGHTGPTCGVAFAAGGKRLASAGYDGTIRLWDVQNGRQLAVLTGHQGEVMGLAFDPQGKLLASGSYDKRVGLWSAQSGALRQFLSGHKGRVHGVSFSPDGTLLASGGYDKTIRIWRAKDGSLVRVLTGHTAGVLDVGFGPRGKLLASCGVDGTIRLWDVASGVERRVLTGHQGWVHGISFAPDGRLLASGGGDGVVRLWNLEEESVRELERLPGRVYWLGFGPRGLMLGVPRSGRMARIWQLASSTHHTLIGHREEVNYIRFSPDGALVATTGDDQTVRLWRTATGTPYWRAPVLLSSPARLYTHQGWLALEQGASRRAVVKGRWARAVEQRARIAQQAPSAGLLCMQTHRDRLELWDLRSDRRLFSRPARRVRHLAALAAGCLTLAERTLQLHPRSGKEPVEVMTGVDVIARDRDQLLVAAGRRVHVLGASATRTGTSYSADIGVTACARSGESLLLGYRDGNVELVSLRTGARRTCFLEEVASSPVTRLLPGPQQTVIVGFQHGLLGMWDVATGKRLAHSRLHGPVVHLMQHGHRLVAATELGDHLVWQMDTLYLDYCTLLRQVWGKVPVTWEGGIPVVREAPRDHRCAGVGRPGGRSVVAR